MIKDPCGSGMVEASITINGVALTFAESMTVRVALGSFAMYVSDPDTVEALGPIANAYRERLDSVTRILHDSIEAERERRRQAQGMPRKILTDREWQREVEGEFVEQCDSGHSPREGHARCVLVAGHVASHRDANGRRWLP